MSFNNKTSGVHYWLYLKSICRFSNNKSGGVAVIFAMVLLPTLLLVGAAIDSGGAAFRSTALQSAADAAALAAAQAARSAIQIPNADWQTAATVAGTATFKANARKIPGGPDTSLAFTPVFKNGNIEVSLNWSTNSPTIVLSAFGIKTQPYAGLAKAALTPEQYTDIHIVVDVSGSMGIGATAADQQTLLTATGCAIACHYTNNTGQLNTLPQARASGAKMRIDVVRDALAAALKTIPNTGTTRVAIYGLSSSLITLLPLTSDIAAATAAAATVDLTDQYRQGGSNITYTLNQLATKLSSTGNGLTPLSATGIVMLATDGVQNSVIMYAPDANGLWHYSNSPSSNPNYVLFAPTYTEQGLQGMDSSACTPIKAKGYTMMTLETVYLTPTGLGSDGRFQFISGTLAPSITGHMQSCASSKSMAFSATSSSEIAKAVAAMFDTSKALRLTK